MLNNITEWMTATIHIIWSKLNDNKIENTSIVVTWQLTVSVIGYYSLYIAIEKYQLLNFGEIKQASVFQQHKNTTKRWRGPLVSHSCGEKWERQWESVTIFTLSKQTISVWLRCWYSLFHYYISVLHSLSQNSSNPMMCSSCATLTTCCMNRMQNDWYCENTRSDTVEPHVTVEAVGLEVVDQEDGCLGNDIDKQKMCLLTTGTQRLFSFKGAIQRRSDSLMCSHI